jgi:hypothetical protein
MSDMSGGSIGSVGSVGSGGSDVQGVQLGWCVCSLLCIFDAKKSEETKCAKFSGMSSLTRLEKNPLIYSLTYIEQKNFKSPKWGYLVMQHC